MIACFVSWDGYTHSHKNYPVTDSYGRLSPDPDNDYGINIVYRVRSDGGRGLPQLCGQFLRCYDSPGNDYVRAFIINSIGIVDGNANIMISYGSPGIYSTNYASWVNSDGVLGSGIHYDVNSGSYG